LEAVRLHARHLWLVAQLSEHRGRMLRDPEYFSAKIAGWWCWGLSQWIGSGWCDGRLEKKRPVAGSDNAGRGIHALRLPAKRPHLGGNGNGSGSGVHRRKIPNLTAAYGNGTGVHRVSLQLPRCNGLGGQGLHGARVEGIYDWFMDLQLRLRRALPQKPLLSLYF
jgi:hypothetical protein